MEVVHESSDGFLVTGLHYRPRSDAKTQIHYNRCKYNIIDLEQVQSF